MPEFVVEKFGGLRLLNDPKEVGAEYAVDMADMDVDRQGRLRARYGFTEFTGSSGANRYDSMAFFAGQNEIVAGAGNRLEAIDIAGAVVTSSVAPTASPHTFVQYGTPTSVRMYIANGVDQIRKYASGAFSSPAGLASRNGAAIAAFATRLVTAGEIAFPSRVWFSNAGDPETFTYAAGPPETGDFVDIDPGDGERFGALATWGPYLFAFKQTKFAVFSSPAEDNTGGALFNYRMVDTGVGLAAAGLDSIGANATCVAPEGVYFMGRDGLYVTSGGNPQYVSGGIEPLLREDTPTGFSGAYWITASTRMVWREGRIYLQVSELGGSKRLYVYDIRQDAWMRWTVPVNALCVTDWTGGALAGRSRIAFAYSTGTNRIAHLGDTSTVSTDNGTAITWAYQSGAYDLGLPAQQKKIRDLFITGTGTITVQVASDLGAVDTGSSVALGGSASEGRQRVARRGELFSYKLSGTGMASVHRLVHVVHSVRPVGVR